MRLNAPVDNELLRAIKETKLRIYGEKAWNERLPLVPYKYLSDMGVICEQEILVDEYLGKKNISRIAREQYVHRNTVRNLLRRWMERNV